MLTAALLAIAPASQGAAETSWSFAETKDAMTDAVSWSIYAYPEAPAPEGAYLQFSCTGGSGGVPAIRVSIEWGVPLYPLYPTGEVDAVSVDARFGDGDPVTLGFAASKTYTLTWEPHDGMQAISGFGELFLGPLRGKAVNFAWTPLQFFEAMTSSAKTALRATAVNSHAVTLLFDNEGLMDALRQLPDVCLPDGYREALGPSGTAQPVAEVAQDSGGGLDILGTGWVLEPSLGPSDIPASVLAGRQPTDGVQIMARSLAFLEDGLLVRIMDPSWGKLQLFAIYDPHTSELMWPLDGKSQSLYTYLAANEPVIDTELKARHMFWTYMFFIQAEEGPFGSVESVDDYLFPSSLRDADPEAWARIREHLEPTRCDQTGDVWSCSGSLYYSNAIFDAIVEFRPGGKPEMVSDAAVFADLPVKIDMPIR